MTQQRTGATPSQEGQGRQETQGRQEAQARQAQPAQPADQERQRPVDRERGASGTAMQQGGRQPGTALGGRTSGQSSLLPAFMASPGLMASAFMSNPFAFAQAMSQEMDRLFSSVGGGLGASRGGAWSQGLQGTPGMQGSQRGALAQWAPPMEVVQRGNELVVRADLPGLTPDDVQIDVEDGVLTVSGERRQEHEERDEGFYRSERSYGAFSRSIALPEGVDPDQVRATFQNGVLDVTVPLPQQQQRQRGRRVQIQSGGARPESGRAESGRAEGGRVESGRAAAERTTAS